MRRDIKSRPRRAKRGAFHPLMSATYKSQGPARDARAGMFDHLRLQIHPEKGAPACFQCLDLGYVFEPGLIRADAGGFVLCECQKKITLCDGRPPYEYYDPARRGFVACPSKPARIRLDRLHALERKSDVPRRYRGSFLDDIQPVDKTVVEALDNAVNVIVEFGKTNGERHGLFLWGGTGCGKTLLSCAVLNEILRFYNAPVRYAKISRDILSRIRASFNPNSEFYGEGRKIEQELASVAALVIDDFGVHRESEWVNEVLYDLIDARYENNLLTILTSNESLDSFRASAGARIHSRLKEMCYETHIDAPDFRTGRLNPTL